MQERGVYVAHVTVHRWAIKVLPVLATVSSEIGEWNFYLSRLNFLNGRFAFSN